MKKPLPNPVAYEALLQLQRHLLLIQKRAGFNYDFTKVEAVPKDIENAQLTLNQPLINIEWDVDDCLDVQRGLRVAGYSLWESSVFLCFSILINNHPHKAKCDLFADIFKYFRGGPNAGGKWTLPTENGIDVVREIWFVKSASKILNYQAKPLLKGEIQLKIHWGMSEESPYIPY